MNVDDLDIQRTNADELVRHIDSLSALLRDCVHAGASINFVLPFDIAAGETFWREKVLPGLTSGRRWLWIARAGDRIAGSVQLDCDTPPNQPHRAEVAKLIVHPDFRRMGIALKLMKVLETHAQEIGRTLLTLDTRSGDKAEPLYQSLGYQTVGTIPGYSRDPFEDKLDATTIMYKNIEPAG